MKEVLTTKVTKNTKAKKPDVFVRVLLDRDFLAKLFRKHRHGRGRWRVPVRQRAGLIGHWIELEVARHE